jgi:hypothetical protein
VSVARPAAEATVDFKKLGNALTVIGALTLVGAFIWWFSFYSSVARDIGRATGGQGDASVFDAWSCLYSSGGICTVVTGVSALVGKTVYEPMLFWFGLAGLLLGLLIRFTAKPGGTA